MVSAYGYRHERDDDEWDRYGVHKIYILPYPINKRLTFPETIKQIKDLDATLRGRHHHKILVEDVGYQRSVIETLHPEGLNMKGVKITTDKRSRLSMTAHWIKEGKILFPTEGAEQLIQQLTGFGTEKHDDLVDAFSILIAYMIEKLTRPTPRIWVL